MYKQHMPAIRDAMRHDITVFKRGVMFAICSIRQPMISVPDQLQALFDPTEDNNENPLFGNKFAAWAFINDETQCAQLWCELRHMRLDANKGPMGDGFDQLRCEHAITALLRIPGLGIVKAAFVAQLMGFNIACLDARNVTRDKRNPRAYRTDGKTPQQLAGKVRLYVADTYGKSEQYWDAWCEDVAPVYNKSPEEISAMHLAIIPSGWVPF